MKQKIAWREAAWIFVISRLVMLLITYIAIIRFPIDNCDHYLPQGFEVQICGRDIIAYALSWWRWDVVHFVAIAHDGYAQTSNTAFFPFWPLLVHGVGWMLGGSEIAYYGVSIVLSNLFFYLALVLFYCLIKLDFEGAVARKALVYLAFFPYALFFFAGYSESLFLLLCLLVFWFLRRGGTRNFWLAGLCACLAVLTRATGVILIVPFIVLYVQQSGARTLLTLKNWREKVGVLLPVLLIPLGVLTYMAYLWATKGNPVAL